MAKRLQPLKESRWHQYASWMMQTGSTAIEAAAHFNVSKNTIHSAIHWAKDKGITTEESREMLQEHVDELTRLYWKANSQLDAIIRRNLWTMDIAETIINGDVPNSPVVNIPVPDLKGFAAVMAQMNQNIKLRMQALGLLEKGQKTDNTQINIFVKEADAKL